jgi:hypothetical protein
MFAPEVVAKLQVVRKDKVFQAREISPKLLGFLCFIKPDPYVLALYEADLVSRPLHDEVGRATSYALRLIRGAGILPEGLDEGLECRAIGVFCRLSAGIISFDFP